jgi:hypothetical protein
MHQAVEVFKFFGNLRAQGTCYLNIGCLIASQDSAEYSRAMNYVDESIRIQELIMRDLRENPTEESLGNRDKVILSSRYFTQGVILFTRYVRQEQLLRETGIDYIDKMLSLEDQARMSEEKFRCSINSLYCGKKTGESQSMDKTGEQSGCQDNNEHLLDDTDGFLDYLLYQQMLCMEINLLRYNIEK